MKLKNILYIGLALFVCTGCSKDEDHGNEPKGKALLSVKVSANGTAASGAVMKGYTPDKNNELPGEANVNNLTVLVFNENGTAMLADPHWSDTRPANGSVTITDIEVSPAKAQIVFVANTENGTFDGIGTYTDFENKLAQLAGQRQDNLTMSSRVISTEKALVAGDNYLGYSSMGDGNINGIASPIEITRLPARLDLANVRTDFTKTILMGRSVTVESIYVKNQKTASRFFSPGYWGTVMTDGNLSNSTVTPLGIVANNTTSLAETPYIHYVMENKTETVGATLAAPTQFVIRATLAASGEYQAETQTFVATINENGMLKEYDHNYIKRNYVYRITITFRDKNFEGDRIDPPVDPPIDPVDPPETEEAQLDVQVQVIGWGPVNQDVEI